MTCVGGCRSGRGGGWDIEISCSSGSGGVVVVAF